MKQELRNDSRRRRKSAGRAELGLGDLMLAVLEDALVTYNAGLTSPVPAKRIEAFKVEAWVASEDVDWPFAFVNVCQAIGISPEYVRTCMTRCLRGLAVHLFGLRDRGGLFGRHQSPGSLSHDVPDCSR